jgi:hypothetical protein
MSQENVEIVRQAVTAINERDLSVWWGRTSGPRLRTREPRLEWIVEIQSS